MFAGEADHHEGGGHTLLHGWECCSDLMPVWMEAALCSVTSS